MSNSIPPLIHIGYQKTALKLLQKQLFSSAEFGFRALDHEQKTIHRAFFTRGLLEGADPKTAEKLVNARKRRETEGLRIVVSHEQLYRVSSIRRLRSWHYIGATT